MTTALMERPGAPVVTDEQADLVKRTVAQGATPDEIKLYMYDCARQGVHPLDKLLHFTKRGGKYTPVTSIDLMRTRAADTGEYAGSDDAVFDTDQARVLEGSVCPGWARVTVWRLVQGQRCAFTATARWSEYYPGDGAAGTMWRKMPHTMLAKCAEALALRKGFPRQLAGLYAKEELDQAQPDQPQVMVSAPPAKDQTANVTVGAVTMTPTAEELAALPDGAVYIATVTAGRAGGRSHGAVITHQGEEYPFYHAQLKPIAEQACQDRAAVFFDVKVSESSGKPYIKDIKRAAIANADLDAEIVAREQAKQAGKIF